MDNAIGMMFNFPQILQCRSEVYFTAQKSYPRYFIPGIIGTNLMSEGDDKKEMWWGNAKYDIFLK
ncbi:TPA: hypothetical protein ACS70C_003294 [Providencia alcalifaciens]